MRDPLLKSVTFSAPGRLTENFVCLFDLHYAILVTKRFPFVSSKGNDITEEIVEYIALVNKGPSRVQVSTFGSN